MMMTQPLLVPVQELPTQAADEQWHDWFEADHFPFSVQASVEKPLEATTAFQQAQALLKSRLSALLSAFAETAKTERLLTVHGLAETFAQPEQQWEFEWMLCTNATIQAWNADYRQKESPTDVLSFPAFESEATLLEATDDAEAIAFFTLQKQHGGSLGTIVVSWDYAFEATQKIQPDSTTPAFQAALITYVLERFCHGCLHLLGVHHETQEKYERVLALQAQTLEKITP
jgi:rRNA maturation RNase YbeY